MICPCAAIGLAAAAVLLTGCSPGMNGNGGASADSYMAEAAREETARKSDPAWKPQSEEVSVIRVGAKGKGGTLQNFCLHTNGNILACWDPQTQRPLASPATKGEIRVFNPDGTAVETWPLPLVPEAICAHPDGSIFVAGKGRLAKLDAAGKVLAEAALPGAQTAARQVVTGLAVSGSDLFVACPSPSDFTYVVLRLDSNLKEPVQIIKGLRGCCGQMDIQARDGTLWVAHNAKHRVESYTRDGKPGASFGKYDRAAADGFGGCCEPKNLRLASDGNIYAAESGPPVTIKRFSTTGKFLGLAALPKFASSCVRVSVEVSPDCKRYYILSTDENSIHVMAANP